MRRLALWFERLLLLTGVLLLAWYGSLLGESWLFQKTAGRQLDARIADLRQSSPAVPTSASPETTPGLIGRLEVSRLGVSVVVMEGVGDKTLRHAIGHIPGTALPGQPGNVGIAGHRDTFFRPLQGIRDEDIVSISTPNGEFRYRVVSTRIVSPDDVSVLESGTKEVLTLVTCYPFYFVGAAPDRFIVRAQRVI